MNDGERKGTLEGILPLEGAAYCTPTADGHCITCSDEALSATIVSVNQEQGSALVTVQEVTEEIDITLVDTVAPGDIVLVHGGVAIALVSEANNE
jgi:hydrogenase maturation factor